MEPVREGGMQLCSALCIFKSTLEYCSLIYIGQANKQTVQLGVCAMQTRLPAVKHTEGTSNLVRAMIMQE